MALGYSVVVYDETLFALFHSSAMKFPFDCFSFVISYQSLDYSHQTKDTEEDISM